MCFFHVAIHALSYLRIWISLCVLSIYWWLRRVKCFWREWRFFYRGSTQIVGRIESKYKNRIYPPRAHMKLAHLAKVTNLAEFEINILLPHAAFSQFIKQSSVCVLLSWNHKFIAHSLSVDIYVCWLSVLNCEPEIYFWHLFDLQIRALLSIWFDSHFTHLALYSHFSALLAETNLIVCLQAS